MADCPPASVEYRRQVDVERPLPILIGRLEDIAPRDDPGIVDEHVQPACDLDGIVDQLFAISLVPEVAGLAPDILSGSVEFGLEHVQASLVGVAGNHTKAVRDELLGDRLPDTSRRACYHSSFLFNASHSSGHL